MSRVLLAIFLLFVLSSCSTVPTYTVNIDSLAEVNAESSGTYTIIPINDSISTNDLQFLEFVRYIRASLPVSVGQYVEPNTGADLVVLLDYGIGDPTEEISSYSIPQFGQTGVSSAQTYGTVSTYGNTGTYSGTTTYTPTYGITGYSTHVQSRQTYQRYIALFAYKLNSDGAEPKQIWQTRIVSRGSNNDFRSVFPIILSAASTFIATDTNGMVTVAIKEDADSVLRLKAAAQ